MKRGQDPGRTAGSAVPGRLKAAGTWLGRVLALAAGLHAGMPAAAAAEAATSFAWPHGARAAVSLAYDDALDSQLDQALPALDRHGLKGSFYLTLSNPAVARRMEEWRAAARRGHELGNHSLFHQCARSKPGRHWVEPHRDLDTTSVEQMRDQILLANTMLTAIDARQERTLTLPCGDTLAGGRDYLPAVRASFVAIKVTGGSGVIDAMQTLDPLAVPVATPVGSSGAELIAIVKQAMARGTMVNFTFHGIGGDYLSVSAQAHRELLRFLADNRRVVWTDTFLNIMQHVRQQQARTPAAP
ncbi:polysaccharide deacetylase family protein [Massilia sp.]|uniref:polysaccharide deacetylase family protein n=1 Tax=Massilia sp. TaxID=1882437 RepID=UPI00391AEF4B